MICRTTEFLLAHTLMGTPEAPTGAVPPPGDGWRPTEIGSIDSEDGRVRCHWEYAADADRCEAVLEDVAISWAAQVDGLGFAAPIPDDDGILDIYISDDETAGGAYTYGPYRDEDTSDGRMGCSAYIALDPAIPDRDMLGYVAHEFNHVLQYGMDFTEPTLPMWEATATAVEPHTDDSLEVWTEYVEDFQDEPWVGVLQDGYMLWDDYRIWSYYEYGAAIWPLHMDSVYGTGDGTLLADWWWASIQQGWTNEPDVIDAYDEITGDWVSALVDLSIARASIGTPSAPAWADFLEGDAPLGAKAVGLAELPTTAEPEYMPYQTGTAYIKVVGLQQGQTLDVTLDGIPGVQWVLLVAEPGVGGDWIEGDSLSWTGSGGDVFVGALNMGSVSFDSDDTTTQADVSFNLELDRGDVADDDTGGGGEDEKGGCGCATAGGARSAWALGLLGLLAVRRRRSDWL